MRLEPLMTYHANLGDGLDLGQGPYGHRLIVEVHGGAFEGPRLKGKLRDAGCADWLAVGADGYGHLDVRATFETDDGAFIYVQYNGHVEMTEAVQNAIAGDGTTDYGDNYFFTTPRMQTGDPRYQWVNNLICIGQGRVRDGRVEYQVFAVMND